MRQIENPEATIMLVIQNSALGQIAVIYLNATPDEWRELTMATLPAYRGQYFQCSGGYNTLKFTWIGDSE